MSFRLGVDLDGTLADLGTMYRRYSEELASRLGATETAAGSAEAGSADVARLREAKSQKVLTETVWRALRQTPNLWTQLEEIEPGAVALLHECARKNGWEVYFITQRPSSQGEPVQLQSQRWLEAKGFLLPTVVTVSGSRGRMANVLDLDVLVDDLPQNCVDVIADSRCRPILLQRQTDATADAAAGRLGIQVTRTFREALANASVPVETGSRAPRAAKKSTWF